MSTLYQKLDRKKSKDIRVLANFVNIYCRENHRQEDKNVFPVEPAVLRQSLGRKELVVCTDCRKLLQHGMAKLLQCPYDPKPMCKKCETHCYALGYREKIREVMRFSGSYLIKHGRLDLLIHYKF